MLYAWIVTRDVDGPDECETITIGVVVAESPLFVANKLGTKLNTRENHFIDEAMRSIGMEQLEFVLVNGQRIRKTTLIGGL